MKRFTILVFLFSLLLSGAWSESVYAQRKTSSARRTTKVQRIKQIVGLVDGGTSMHSLFIHTLGQNSKMVNICMDDDTDDRQSYIVEGNTVRVWYKTVNGMMVATRIVGDSIYSNALGDWLIPDPINKKKVMGVRLTVNGEAASINMATMPFTSWRMVGTKGTLILKGKSIGNGQTTDVADTVDIYFSKGEWLMKSRTTNVVYTRHDYDENVLKF